MNLLQKFNRYLLLCSTIIVLNLSAWGQEKEANPLSVQIELSSRYLWRGLEYGNAPTLFPSLQYSTSNFNFSIAGAYAFNNSHREVDLSVSYCYKNWTLSLSDYYFHTDNNEHDHYFNWANSSTKHSVECCLNYEFPHFPLRLLWSTYIYGNDKKEDFQAYSSYTEICYTHHLKNGYMSLTCGASIKKGFYTSYQKDFALCNISLAYLTDLKVGQLSQLPVKFSYIINPYLNKSFITISLYWNSI